MGDLSDAERAELFQRACSEFARYFWVELGWEKWRAEWLKDPVSFKNKNSSSENAALLLEALDKISAYHPRIKTIIDREKA